MAGRTGPRPAVAIRNELPTLSASPLRASGSFGDGRSLAERLAASTLSASPGAQRRLSNASPPPFQGSHNSADSLRSSEGVSRGHDDQFREEVASFLLSSPYTVSIFGAGFQGGQPIGGVETAPEVLRADGALAESLYRIGWEVVDKGNVDMRSELNHENDPPVEGVNAPLRVPSDSFHWPSQH